MATTHTHSRRFTPRRSGGALLGAWALALVLAQGCTPAEETAQESLCLPGSNIFCRCEGGDPGTKECLSSGEEFGSCGPCEPRPTTSSGTGGSTSTSGTGGSTSTSGTGGGGGGTIPGDLPLLAFCEQDGDCLTAICRFHFCTKPCDKVSDCPYPDSECISNNPNGETMCMPSCDTAGDCSAYQAPPSMCGYTTAVDNWDVTVCADWGDSHALMPINTDCQPFDHGACNLGYQHKQLVCPAQGICIQGCFLNSDCPQPTTCSAQGSLGNCQ
ncbi:MAG: hypothetical protein JRI68_09050 [Deltaproteobacteria bacterium]|nr:hypothetical protein [Deltaproteobacteria bacterium]